MDVRLGMWVDGWGGESLGGWEVGGSLGGVGPWKNAHLGGSLEERAPGWVGGSVGPWKKKPTHPVGGSLEERTPTLEERTEGRVWVP